MLFLTDKKYRYESETQWLFRPTAFEQVETRAIGMYNCTRIWAVHATGLVLRASGSYEELSGLRALSHRQHKGRFSSTSEPHEHPAAHCQCSDWETGCLSVPSSLQHVTMTTLTFRRTKWRLLFELHPFRREVAECTVQRILDYMSHERSDFRM